MERGIPQSREEAADHPPGGLAREDPCLVLLTPFRRIQGTTPDDLDEHRRGPLGLGVGGEGHELHLGPGLQVGRRVQQDAEAPGVLPGRDLRRRG